MCAFHAAVCKLQKKLQVKKTPEFIVSQSPLLIACFLTYHEYVGEGVLRPGTAVL